MRKGTGKETGAGLRARLRNGLKMAAQHALLPLACSFFRLAAGGKEKDRIVLADSHHETLPFSLRKVKEELIRRGYEPAEYVYDGGRLGDLRSLGKALGFMRLFARARAVFICDNFLPVSSCRKTEGTEVIQLWHSCGLLKKFGYDTPDDIPAYYRGDVYRNYDLVTVSADCVMGPVAGAMRQPEGVVRATGVSRTDAYYDRAWREECRERFFRLHPEAEGKKVVLWAPTFRGTAAEPVLAGEAEIRELGKELGEEFCLLTCAHPHLDRRGSVSDCGMPTEEALCAADLLISDYSSIIFDWLFFRRPFVLFAPDLEEYERDRGFYVPYGSLSPHTVTDPALLKETVLRAMEDRDGTWLDRLFETYDGACDGASTARILDLAGLKEAQGWTAGR